ncbi:MAG TPA: M64 family metallopeptidase [Actinophytocola sp.]|uniref:M64 family metallopeptidase n=1 Tax=Actinophytocola sp. TaxID=1872138 RepID=UPI002DB7D804|nr:M64 family metallopeptidase [Actinophytocola sp.]HEU5470548.1 M64 family metallopeptidase [Actinophytocola sp.]
MRRSLLAAAVSLGLAVGGVAALPAAAHAAPGDAVVVPVQVTGDPAKRFNMVLLGDGYTEAEQAKFREHVDKHLNVLWTIEPFKTYRSYVNVYAVEIISGESGVDCDPNLDSPRRDTPLNMGFWGGCNPNSVQRLLTVDGAAANRYANLVAGTTPGNRQLLALGNSDTYGGAGGSNATASGGNALSALISPHELGHSLGNLQDEYDYLARGVRGAAYTGPEPFSVHHTLLTERQLRDQQQKWWRWLGERSESGGTIGRYESGMHMGNGVWRPSAHSIMKTLGYYYDQPGREQMTQRISAKTSILQDATPDDVPVGADRVVWVETLHPVAHSLAVTWTLDGAVLPTGGAHSVDLSTMDIPAGVHTLTATVVDPTVFVRDPAIRGSAALTRTRSWTVDTAVVTPPEDVPVEITAATPTGRPVGGTDVVYVETSHPRDVIPPVTWTLDGRPIAAPGNDRELALAGLGLSGRHTLTATAGASSRMWTIDARRPETGYELSAALLTVPKPGRTEFIFNGPFTMRLTGTDDTPGFVVREFQTDGDGWFNYFGWPTDPDLPFLFTPSGTNIDNLIYGKLGVPRLSPWDDPTPSYGRHTIAYRAIDPAGNYGTPEEFVVTLLPEPPACTATITGRHRGSLVVSTGVTCLDRAEVAGPVLVRPGASLVASGATVAGPVVAAGAAAVELLDTTVRGPLSVTGTTADLTVVGGAVHGPVSLSGNRTGTRAPVLAGVVIHGPLYCAGNTPGPENLQAPNTVRGPVIGQCAQL